MALPISLPHDIRAEIVGMKADQVENALGHRLGALMVDTWVGSSGRTR